MVVAAASANFEVQLLNDICASDFEEPHGPRVVNLLHFGMHAGVIQMTSSR